MATDTGTEVAIPDSIGAISSFAEALEYARSQGAVIDSSELGDGFNLLKDKDKLIGVPFIIIGVRKSEGDYPEKSESGEIVTDDDGNTVFSTYSVIRLVTERGSKVVIIDGGSGINAQLDTLDDSVGGVLVRGGLVRSDYTYEGAPAHTYYLDTAGTLTGAL